MRLSDFSDELKVALSATTGAATLMMQRVGADRVREKAPADLVTEVDEAAEALIIDRIATRYPNDLIIAEESAAAARGTGRRWIIDPIDGTVNFVHGYPFTCVSVAFLDELGPAVGVIHAPMLGEVFVAVRGTGARLNGDPIRVSRVERGESGLYATGFPFKEGKGDPERYFQLVADVVRTTHGVRRAGAAALDLAYVAAGRLDGYFEIGLSPWDVAAGLLLVQEAGGATSGWPGDAEDPLASGRVLASNGRVHGWLERKVGAYGL